MSVFKRRRVGTDAYQHKNTVTGDYASVRRLGPSRWGVTFRAPDGRPIKRASLGEEIEVASREAGEELAERVLTEA